MAAPSSARRSGSVSERSFGRQATRATHVQREDCTRSAMQAYLGEWMIPLEVACACFAAELTWLSPLCLSEQRAEGSTYRKPRSSLTR